MVDLYQGLKIKKAGMSTYVHINDAYKFVHRCMDENIRILGFEGIFCEEGSRRPSLDLITDFSNLNKSIFTEAIVRESCSSALEILSQFPSSNDLYIDFVISEE